MPTPLKAPPPDFAKFIPLDKAWIIRLGFLDILNGRSERIQRKIEKWSGSNSNESLPIDIRALVSCARVWDDKTAQIPVADSRTLHCFLKFATWKNKEDRLFRIGNLLHKRNPSQDAAIVGMNQRRLMNLEGGHSVWASAAAINGDKERMWNPPVDLELTYRAISSWRPETDYSLFFDQTIIRHVEVIDSCFRKKIGWKPGYPEDYCLARVLGVMDMQSGKSRWPELAGVNNNRIMELEKQIGYAQKGEQITSNDHRIVQALAVKAILDNKEIRVKDPECVAKSWPKFWEFLYAVGEKRG
jgi:hypothetical protein